MIPRDFDPFWLIPIALIFIAFEIGGLAPAITAAGGCALGWGIRKLWDRRKAKNESTSR